MKNQMTQINEGTKLFILIGMLIESQANLPVDILRSRLTTILKEIKSTDSQKFNGLKVFLKSRGIKINM